MDSQQERRIETIKKLLKQIDRKDYEVPRVRLVKNLINLNNDNYSTYENNFVTKFNEQYGIAEYNGIITNHRDLQKQLQITKKYIYSAYNDKEVEDGYEKLRIAYGDNVDNAIEFEMIPDFFIHKDQCDKNPKNQQLIIEFKTEQNIPEKRFMWDLFKLNVYLNKYNYQTACFVCINNSKDRVENLLIHYLKHKYYMTTYTDRLHFIIRENYQCEIDNFSLKQFIKKWAI